MRVQGVKKKRGGPGEDNWVRGSNYLSFPLDKLPEAWYKRIAQ